MKKVFIALLAVCVTFLVCFAQEDSSQEVVQDGVQKVILKISTVETVGTRTQKTWNPPAPPMVLQELPYNEQDIAKANDAV